MKSTMLIPFALMLPAMLFAQAAESLPPLKDGKVPATLDELWGSYDPRKEPIEAEVLKEWEQDGIVCRLARYQVGVFKGASSKVAAFYAFPKGGTKLPAVLEMHGGGQSANLDSMVGFAKRGYAGMSLNWGGNKLNFGQSKQTYDGSQTDWGKLDATHPPQRNKANHFAGALAPDEYTLDAVESPASGQRMITELSSCHAGACKGACVLLSVKSGRFSPRHKKERT